MAQRNIKKILLIVGICLYLVAQGVFFYYYFNKQNNSSEGRSVNNTQETDSKVQSNLDQQVQEKDQNATEESNENNPAEEGNLSIIKKGEMKIVERKASSLEATLALRIPVTDRMIKFVSDTASEEVDIAKVEKVIVDNITYEFNLLAYKGKFLDPTNTSYLLQIQIPPRGNIKPIFKWYSFDADIQLVSKINLREKGMTLPAKIVQIKDYDGDDMEEMLLETTKYLNADNNSNPRFLFKAMPGKQIKMIWREESVAGDRATGKSSSVTKIDYDQSNPPPPSDPELICVKRIYSSELIQGMPPSDNYANTLMQSSLIPVITNNVRFEEVKTYPDRQIISAKTLDTYIYTWEINSEEFVYTKTESRNLDPVIE